MIVSKSSKKPWIDTLTMSIPEVFHPQTMSRTHMTDRVIAVLLRRVFARLMNMG